MGWQQADSAGQVPESQWPVQLPPRGLPLLIDSPGEGRSGSGGVHPAPAHPRELRALWALEVGVGWGPGVPGSCPSLTWPAAQGQRMGPVGTATQADHPPSLSLGLPPLKREHDLARRPHSHAGWGPRAQRSARRRKPPSICGPADTDAAQSPRPQGPGDLTTFSGSAAAGPRLPVTPVPGPHSGTWGGAGEASDAEPVLSPGRTSLLGQHGPTAEGQSWGREKCQNQIREAQGRAFKQKPGVSVQSSSALWQRQRTSQDPPDLGHQAPRGQLGNSGMARQFPVPTWFRPDLRALRKRPGRGLGWGLQGGAW